MTKCEDWNISSTITRIRVLKCCVRFMFVIGLCLLLEHEINMINKPDI